MEAVVDIYQEANHETLEGQSGSEDTDVLQRVFKQFGTPILPF